MGAGTGPTNQSSQNMQISSVPQVSVFSQTPLLLLWRNTAPVGPDGARPRQPAPPTARTPEHTSLTVRAQRRRSFVLTSGAKREVDALAPCRGARSP